MPAPQLYSTKAKNQAKNLAKRIKAKADLIKLITQEPEKKFDTYQVNQSTRAQGKPRVMPGFVASMVYIDGICTFIDTKITQVIRTRETLNPHTGRTGSTKKGGRTSWPRT